MQEWYVHENGATTGPFTTEAVKESIKAGKIGALATFCVTGTTTWRPIAELPELVPAKPTELPIATKKACGACSCPIARNLKRILVLVAFAAIAYVVWMKFGVCCQKAIIRPL